VERRVKKKKDYNQEKDREKSGRPKASARGALSGGMQQYCRKRILGGHTQGRGGEGAKISYRKDDQE